MPQKELVTGTPNLYVYSLAGASQCPGCQSPVVERIILETLEELGVDDQAIGVGGVGCTGFNFPLIANCDGTNTAHGRAPDVATAIKRVYPDRVVFTIQGDGDCIAIGAGSLVNAAQRAERITIIMVNNANYGTTGGQMAPTTPLGMVTATTPEGRPASYGYPAHVPEMLACFRGVCYTARGAVNTAANFQRTKRYIRTAFQKQLDGVGMSFVEVLSACPSDWHLTPVKCLQFIEEQMIPEYPLGEYKNVDSID